MCIRDRPSALNSVELKKIVLRSGLEVVESKNIKDALKKIPSKEKSVIVIFGSLYLVGHVLSIN